MQKQLIFSEATPKLSHTHAAIVEITQGGRWLTIAEIQRGLGGKGIQVSQTGLSMRMRELRTKGYVMECRPVGVGRKLFEYRIERTT